MPTLQVILLVGPYCSQPRSACHCLALQAQTDTSRPYVVLTVRHKTEDSKQYDTMYYGKESQMGDYLFLGLMWWKRRNSPCSDEVGKFSLLTTKIYHHMIYQPTTRQARSLSSLTPTSWSMTCICFLAKHVAFRSQSDQHPQSSSDHCASTRSSSAIATHWH